MKDSNNYNRKSEGELHNRFKVDLFQKIQASLEQKRSLRIEWNCTYCGIKHKGNFLKKIASAKLEYRLLACIPDIALFDRENVLVAVVEVVVTSKPTKKALNYYEKNNIFLIQFDVKEENDFQRINNDVLIPNHVSICYNPRCNTCNNFQQRVIMKIIDGICWKCGTDMKIAAISSSRYGWIRGGTNCGPSEFKKDEINFARQKGVLLKIQYSKTAESSYLANTCPKCNMFTGDHYLFSNFIAPANYGDLTSESFELGYNCENCEELKYSDD